MKTILEHLIAEKELLSDPARWTKDEVARDEDEVAVDEYSPDAVCWCQHGATLKVVYDIKWATVAWWQIIDFKNNVASTLGIGLFSNAIHFNDSPSTTHADLMDFYDKCIAKASDIA